MEAIKFSELPSGDRLPLTDEAFFPIVANNENRTLTYGRLKNQLTEQTHTDKVADLEDTKVPTAGAVEKRVRTTENNMKTLETLAQAAHYKAENIEKKVDANTEAIKTADQKIDSTKSELQGKITATDSKIDTTKSELEGKITAAEGKIAPAVNSAKEELNKTITQNKSELEQKIETIELTPGPAGPAGPRGPEGSKGDKGDNGADGERGEAGPAGPAGPAGAAGKDGATPSINPENQHWMINGQDTGVSAAGEGTGPQGPAGKDGANGLPALTCSRSFSSKYEVGQSVTAQYGDSVSRKPVVGDYYFVLCAKRYFTLFKVTAVDEAATNFKSEAVSVVDLKGDKGDRGETGPAGENGKDGAEGPRGEAGPAGPAGPAGANGEAGAPGKDGDAALECSYISLPSETGEVGHTFSVDPKNCNRTPKVGDIFLMARQGGELICTCQVTAKSSDTAYGAKVISSYSIKGAKGDRGEQGPAGPAGPAGGGGDTSALESRISTIETEIESLKSDIQTLLNAINTALEEIK